MSQHDKKDNAAIQRFEDTAAGSNIAETIVNIFKAALATAPFCGGIASLMTDYIPSSRFRRLEDFAQQTAEDLRQQSALIDESYLKTDDFAFMFERCFRGAAVNPQREKLNAFRGILINSAIRQDMSSEEKEVFVNLADNLSTLHIRVLKFFSDPVSYLKAVGIPAEQRQGYVWQILEVALPGVKLEVIWLIMKDLARLGLLNPFDQMTFSFIITGEGLAFLEPSPSELGKDFVNFCASPSDT